MTIPIVDRPAVQAALSAIRRAAVQNPEQFHRLPHVFGEGRGQIVETTWCAAVTRIREHAPKTMRDAVATAVSEALTGLNISVDSQRIIHATILTIAANDDPSALVAYDDYANALHPWMVVFHPQTFPLQASHREIATHADTSPTPNRRNNLDLPPPPARKRPTKASPAPPPTPAQSKRPVLQSAGRVDSYTAAVRTARNWMRKAGRKTMDNRYIGTLAVFILADAIGRLGRRPFPGTVRGLITQVFTELRDPNTRDASTTPQAGTLSSILGEELLRFEREEGPRKSRWNTERAFDVFTHTLSLSNEELTTIERFLVAATERGTTESGEGQSEGPDVPLASLLDELNCLPGLSNVKSIIAEQAATMMMNAERKRRGLPEVPMNRHMVFTGQPGTGKTTIARMVGRLYAAMGVLTKGHLVETDRSGMIGQYLGSTVSKTTKILDEANGGVLFIDEAYGLVEQGFSKGDAYGSEAVNTLVKYMEDHRDDLVVILAGYPQHMDTFIASNPGLGSRIGRTVPFDDYTPEELLSILLHQCTAHHLHLSSSAQRAALQLFQTTGVEGNGRGVRNLLEAAIGFHALRLQEHSADDLTDTALSTLIDTDISEAARVTTAPKQATSIGFLTSL